MDYHEILAEVDESFWGVAETLNGVVQRFAAGICKTSNCDDTSGNAEWVRHVILTPKLSLCYSSYTSRDQQDYFTPFAAKTMEKYQVEAQSEVTTPRIVSVNFRFDAGDNLVTGGGVCKCSYIYIYMPRTEANT